MPDFEPRAAQQQMATAVSHTLDRGGVLLAEAGTGTGKTLAYLVPAILSGRRVLISTGTKNLQEQIFFKDVPALRDALGVTFSATCMKGRGNYLCLHRFAELRQNTDCRPPSDQVVLGVLERWAATTETGDRAELDDLPEDVGLWNEVAATSDTCLGGECPQYQECYVTRMRQRAAESDVVIVNHHLLCADAAVRQTAYGSVIPDCSVAVLDEAHQLEDVATQYFGVAISTYRVDELLRDADKLLGGGLLEDDAARDTLRDDVRRIRDRAPAFFAALLMLDRFPAGRNAATSEDRVRVNCDRLQPAREAGMVLIGTLESIEADVTLVKDASEDLMTLARRATDLANDLRFLLRADDLDYVFFLEVRGRGIFLRAAPIDVSAIVRELLLDRLHATVLTSATLSVDGSFEYVRGRLGIRKASEIRLPSEFDYGQQALLYLPKQMPDPRAANFPQAVADQALQILTRTKGRAFVLFTSYANLREVHRHLAATLDYPLLVQGTAPRSALLAEFRSTPHAVLLATSSFWQGVDVIGETLSCVIIDKLPFASPSEPITAARIEALAERGGDPFQDYQVPLAILMLLQGLGRLLRHRRDRGVLAILDPRIRRMGYGRRFLQSLPAAPVTHDLQAIDRFFGLVAE